MSVDKVNRVNRALSRVLGHGL